MFEETQIYHSPQTGATSTVTEALSTMIRIISTLFSSHLFFNCSELGILRLEVVAELPRFVVNQLEVRQRDFSKSENIESPNCEEKSSKSEKIVIEMGNELMNWCTLHLFSSQLSTRIWSIIGDKIRSI